MSHQPGSCIQSVPTGHRQPPVGNWRGGMSIVRWDETGSRPPWRRRQPAPQGARMGRGLYHAPRRNPGPHAHAHAHTAAETALGSARVPRASSGVAPELPSHQRPGNFRRGKVCGTRFSARRRKPHARGVCSRFLRRTGCGFAQTHIPPRARREMLLTMGKAGNNVQPMKSIVPHRTVKEQC